MKLSLSTVLGGALLASAIAATPAAALQNDYSTKETRALMHAYAKCVVRRQAAKASEALRINADNGTIARKYGMLISGECLGRETVGGVKMSFSGDLYRYALADAMVNHELAAHEMPELSTLPRLDHREPGEAPSEIAASGRKLSGKKLEEARLGHSRAVAYAFLSKYGECIVRVDSRGSKSLLLTVPDSQEETAGFNALRPALATCMPEGSTVRFGRTALRGSVAINYYRLAHAARAAVAKAS